MADDHVVELEHPETGDKLTFDLSPDDPFATARQAQIDVYKSQAGGGWKEVPKSRRTSTSDKSDKSEG